MAHLRIVGAVLVTLLIVCLSACAGTAEIEPASVVLLASGQGKASASAETAFEKKASAIEAATAVAMARLTERINGIYVQRVVEVKDFEFAGERVEARTKGALAGVRIVQADYDEENAVAEVTVKIEVGADGKPILPEGASMVFPPY